MVGARPSDRGSSTRPGRPGALCFLLLPVFVVLVACSGSGAPEGPPPTPVSPANGVLTVRAFEMGYEPSVIALPQDEEVRIELENDGVILHSFKVDNLDADVIESRSSGPLSGKEGQLFVGADAGGDGTLVFVPRASGTFAFYCTLEGHRQFGMEGTLIVQ